MPMTEYKYKAFGIVATEMIDHCNAIVEEYHNQGILLTLRQIYYKIVARDLFPEDRRWTWTGAKWVRDPMGTKNAQPNYDWLGDLVSDARLAGLMDWTSIVDLTRDLSMNSHWTSPRDIVQSCATQYRLNWWLDQPIYCEVWVEKDAMESVVQPICSALDVPFFSCRGYGSLSALWSAGMRLKEQVEDRGKDIIIFHLGDHDPSGIDMTRDIQDRLEMFVESPVEIKRLALNMNQVRQFKPPPNPAKLTDTRSKGYIKLFGPESWELDALEPTVIRKLITDAVTKITDPVKMLKVKDKQKLHRKALLDVVPMLPAAEDDLTNDDDDSDEEE